MKLRPRSFAQMILTGLGASALFCIAGLILNHQRDFSSPVWTQKCTITSTELSCGKVYSEKFVSRESYVEQAVGTKKLPTVCTGWIGQGPFADLHVSCKPVENNAP